MPTGHEGKTVADVMNAETTTVPLDGHLSDLVAALLDDAESRAVYVVDDGGRLRGVVSFRDVLRAVNARLGVRPPGPAHLLHYFRDLGRDAVRDFMREAHPVTRETLVWDALRILDAHRENDLPVVDDAGVVVGEVKGLDLLRMARETIARTDEELRKDAGPQDA